MPTEEQKTYVSQNYISNTGMPLETIKDIDLNVKKYVRDYVPFWKDLCEVTTFKKGRKEYTYRVTVRPEVSIADWPELVEGYGTGTSTIKMAEYSLTYANYGKHFKYTKESVEENLDDTRQMAIDNFGLYAAEVPEAVIASVLTKSNFTFTPASTITETLDKAAVILRNKKARKFLGGGQFWTAVTTIEVVTKLKQELRDKGEMLPESLKTDIAKYGEVYDYNGFHLIVRDDDALKVKGTDGAVTGYLVLFPTETRDGRKPGRRIPEEIAIFDNGLGSGLIKDPSSGEMVEDTNHRAGSLAINIDHLGVALQQPLGILMTTIPNASAAVYTAENDVTELATATSTNTAPTAA